MYFLLINIDSPHTPSRRLLLITPTNDLNVTRTNPSHRSIVRVSQTNHCQSSHNIKQHQATHRDELWTTRPRSLLDLKRSDWLPSYDEDAICTTIQESALHHDEIKAVLRATNRASDRGTEDGPAIGVRPKMLLHDASVKRNKLLDKGKGHLGMSVVQPGTARTRKKVSWDPSLGKSPSYSGKSPLKLEPVMMRDP